MPNHQYYLGIAEAVAKGSKDTSHKVGAVLVDAEGGVLCTGYNGFPRGVDEKPVRNERPSKYLYSVHAEQNALYQAARAGVSTHGSTLYVWVNANDLGTCAECAKAIIQCGVVRVVIPQLSTVCATWSESVIAAAEMLGESGVELVYA